MFERCKIAVPRLDESLALLAQCLNLGTKVNYLRLGVGNFFDRLAILPLDLPLEFLDCCTIPLEFVKPEL